MTKLLSPVRRETAKTVAGRPVIVTLANCGGQSEARIGVRLKGKRTQYTTTLSDLYRVLAMWHGAKELAAKRAARRDGVPWRFAKRKFAAANSI